MCGERKKKKKKRERKVLGSNFGIVDSLPYEVRNVIWILSSSCIIIFFSFWQFFCIKESLYFTSNDEFHPDRQFVLEIKLNSVFYWREVCCEIALPIQIHQCVLQWIKLWTWPHFFLLASSFFLHQICISFSQFFLLLRLTLSSWSRSCGLVLIHAPSSILQVLPPAPWLGFLLLISFFFNTLS